MFTDDEWYGLLAKLRQLTEEDKISWTIGKGTLSSRVGNTSYTITSRDQDDAPPYVLTVRMENDPGWRVVDEIESVGGPEVRTIPGTMIHPLEQIARRMALGGPKLARKLLADLEQIDPSSPPSYGLAQLPWPPTPTSGETPF